MDAKQILIDCIKQVAPVYLSKSIPEISNKDEPREFMANMARQAMKMMLQDQDLDTVLDRRDIEELAIILETVSNFIADQNKVLSIPTNA